MKIFITATVPCKKDAVIVGKKLTEKVLSMVDRVDGLWRFRPSPLAGSV